MRDFLHLREATRLRAGVAALLMCELVALLWSDLSQVRRPPPPRALAEPVPSASAVPCVHVPPPGPPPCPPPPLSGSAQARLVLAGWLMCAQACLVEQRYEWVVDQLMPVIDGVSSKAEIARLSKHLPLWRPAYLWLNDWAMQRRDGLIARVRPLVRP